MPQDLKIRCPLEILADPHLPQETRQNQPAGHGNLVEWLRLPQASAFGLTAQPKGFGRRGCDRLPGLLPNLVVGRGGGDREGEGHQLWQLGEGGGGSCCCC